MKWKKSRFGKVWAVTCPSFTIASTSAFLSFIRLQLMIVQPIISINHTIKLTLLPNSQCTCAMRIDSPQARITHTERCRTSLVVWIDLDSLLRTTRRTRQGQISDVPLFFIHFLHQLAIDVVAPMQTQRLHTKKGQPSLLKTL